MGQRITEEEADARFEEVGLEPLESYTARTAERRCRCLTCGTTRFVKLAVIGRGGIACRWCHGWEKWLPWSQQARAGALGWRTVDTSPVHSLDKVEALGLIAISEPGDEFTPIGFLCPRCGETGVTVPERIGDGSRGWFGCERCLRDDTQAKLSEAPAVFEMNGLELVGRCRGEYVPQAATCATCGTLRHVALAALRDGTAPLCWTCTHGIRTDEPHRLYLVAFPRLAVIKVGLTHARHDRRLADHELAGGQVVGVADVPDRPTARRVERELIERYLPWATTHLTVVELPQGGWTETWSDTAPTLDLQAEVARVLGRADEGGQG